MPAPIKQAWVTGGLLAGTAAILTEGISTRLAAPTTLTAIAEAGAVDLTWSVSSDSIGTLITRSLHGVNNFQQVGISTGTTFTDAGVTNGLIYDYIMYDLD